MATQKPTIPKGTRDFSPLEVMRRNYIFDTIRQSFQRFGFLPIETPAMEDIETLTGKYGDEGDKLLFKILNSGNYLEKVNDYFDELKGQKSINKLNELLPNIFHQKVTEEDFDIKIFNKLISEKGLRYDLTVPFARYVVMHQNEITFPFKRYQIQPVWRADRPQRGRYREFYQCDADVIGSDSLLNEVEIVQMIDEVFTNLGITITIKINNRKILSGIVKMMGEEDKMMDILIAIDKLEKLEIEKVNKELKTKGVSDEAIKILQRFYEIPNDTKEKIKFMKDFFTVVSLSETGKLGLKEIENIISTLANCQLQTANLSFDLTLARGLSYYTGSIFEVKVNDPKSTFTGSICGGGRYDNLTGIFGLPNVSGVGISFGADRIYDVLEELNLFPDFTNVSTKILFACFGKAEQNFCLPLVSKLRAAGINTEIYPDVVKIKKQFDYANKKSIPYVVVVGSEEMQSGNLTLKNMSSGEQEKVTIGELIKRIS